MLPADKPNGLLEDLGAVMGTEAVMRLIAVFGGASLYVPQGLDRHHPIALVVGWPPFQRLVDAYGGESLSLPDNADYDRLRRLRRVVRLLSEGVSVDEVARQFQVTARTIRNIRNQAVCMRLDGRSLPRG